ncbi:MAG: hypothetical protein PVF45_06140 [Anaerolineae bacterium]|jgi:hypothetical protein
MPKLFFAKFPDGGTYATGSQRDIPGGPIAYELREDAQKIADAIEGRVVERTLDYAISWCLEGNFTLWLKKADGGMAYVEETVPVGESGELVRVEEPVRQAAIEASQALLEGQNGR